MKRGRFRGDYRFAAANLLLGRVRQRRAAWGVCVVSKQSLGRLVVFSGNTDGSIRQRHDIGKDLRSIFFGNVRFDAGGLKLALEDIGFDKVLKGSPQPPETMKDLPSPGVRWESWGR